LRSGFRSLHQVYHVRVTRRFLQHGTVEALRGKAPCH
jgi:hypothetical protein